MSQFPYNHLVYRSPEGVFQFQWKDRMRVFQIFSVKFVLNIFILHLQVGMYTLFSSIGRGSVWSIVLGGWFEGRNFKSTGPLLQRVDKIICKKWWKVLQSKKFVNQGKIFQCFSVMSFWYGLKRNFYFRGSKKNLLRKKQIKNEGSQNRNGRFQKSSAFIILMNIYDPCKLQW